MKIALLLGALLGAPAIEAVCPEIKGYWCGKPYPRCIPEETPAVVHYSAPSWKTQQVFVARSNLDQRSDLQPLEFMITPRLLPYMESDTVASLIIDIAHLHDHTELHIVAEPLFPATRLQPKPTQEVYFDITQLAPQHDPYITQVFIATTDDTVIYQTTFTLYRLPPNPTDASVVRIDHLLGNIIPPNDLSAPIFPYGSYVSGDWILGDSPAAIASLRDSKFKIVNIVPGLPPYDYEPLDKVFQLAEEEGVWIQYDMRWSLTNLTLLEEQIERFKKYKSLLTWYTADEPDGTDWLDTTIAQRAYDLVKRLDPYHPVALVLNCLHASAEYAGTTDIIMTDVYPVGIDLSKCTPTDGVCGCDDCIGSISADIETRWEIFSRDLATVQGKARVPQWMVLQGSDFNASAFGPEGPHWDRQPTPEEETVMVYLSIILGYKSITYWLWPHAPSPDLHSQIVNLAHEIDALSDFLNSYRITVSTSSPYLRVGGWRYKDEVVVTVVCVEYQVEIGEMEFCVEGLSGRNDKAVTMFGSEKREIDVNEKGCVVDEEAGVIGLGRWVYRVTRM